MDLTFILLITFIITFPLIEEGIPVVLPKGKGSELSAELAQTITVDRDGRIFLDDALMGIEQLDARMMELGRLAPDTVVMVRADENVRYGQVIEVMKSVHKAKLSKLAWVTRSEGAS